MTHLIHLIPLTHWNAHAQSNSLEAQKAECQGQIHKMWDIGKNRCVVKKELKALRREESDAMEFCDQFKTDDERKQCYLQNAKDKSQSQLPKFQSSGGVKGIESLFTTTYAAMSLLTMATGGDKSNCLSRTIFGATSLAGSLSEIYIKVKAKKKLEALQKLYQVDLKTSSNEAQIKALEYLKEEQLTMAEIAGLEKKRNLVMMAGYSAAAIMAVIDMQSYVNHTCNATKEGQKEGQRVISGSGGTGGTSGSGDLNGSSGTQSHSAVETNPNAAQVNIVQEGSRGDSTTLAPRSPDSVIPLEQEVQASAPAVVQSQAPAPAVAEATQAPATSSTPSNQITPSQGALIGAGAVAAVVVVAPKIADGGGIEKEIQQEYQKVEKLRNPSDAKLGFKLDDKGKSVVDGTLPTGQKIAVINDKVYDKVTGEEIGRVKKDVIEMRDKKIWNVSDSLQ